jgi:charged multivesicular body protein 3
MKIAKCFGASAEVMKAVNKAISLPEMSKTMREVAFEMEKSGLIQELVSESMDDVFDSNANEEDDEEVDEEVQKVLDSIAGDTFKADLLFEEVPSGKPVLAGVGAGQNAIEASSEEEEEDEEDAEAEDMKARLQAL